MDWKDEVLADVGNGMGVSGLNFGPEGVICFEYERSGSLYMEQKEDGVLMYLHRDIDAFNPLPAMEKALKGCHFTNSYAWPLQVGLKDNQLFIGLFLVDNEFDRPSVEKAIQYLMSKLDQLT
ncbi:hypothetical protein [Endozoicomonas ascidiicola]|uniref:hypothetical protein n=1 Tax=Endozoicomonas ascidiicola TaxID=1698521 RepID=UPI00082C90EF|nr:hypothetical protein [Endozoicomonas ascidiicola]